MLVFAGPDDRRPTVAFATCHCLTLPPSEPGYYFWRDRNDRSHHAAVGVVRDQVAFVTIGRTPREIHDFVHAAAVLRSVGGPIAKATLLSGRRAVAGEARYGRTRAVSHRSGPRRASGASAPKARLTRPIAMVISSSSRWPSLVTTYLDSRPDPAVYDFLRDDFAALEARLAESSPRASATSRRSRSATSSVRLPSPPCEADADGVVVEPLGPVRQPLVYTEADLAIRQFHNKPSSRAASLESRVEFRTRKAGERTLRWPSGCANVDSRAIDSEGVSPR